MGEPITVWLGVIVLAKFVGHVIEHVGYHELHHIYRKILERSQEIPINARTGLPHNHDLRDASLDALRGAALVLVMQLANRLEPSKPWLPRIIEYVRSGNIFKVPLFGRQKGEFGEWVCQLREAVGTDHFSRFHDKLLLSEEDVIKCFSGSDVSCALGPKLTRAFRAWARANVTDKLGGGKEPPDFHEFLLEGWDIGRGHRATFERTYCLFFREHLKHRPPAFRIFMADVLSELQGKVEALPAILENKLDFTEFENWMEPQLATLQNLLGGMSQQIAKLVDGHDHLAGNVGEVLVAVNMLACEVLQGNANADKRLDRMIKTLNNIELKIVELRKTVEAFKVFVSYSHTDRHVAGPVIKLLKTLHNDVAVHLQDSVLNRKWAGEIQRGWERADAVVIFWCHHSRDEAEVEEDWQRSVSFGKRVLPVILDNTELPEPLRICESIDFRHLVAWNHESEQEQTEREKAEKEGKKQSNSFVPLLEGEFVWVAVGVVGVLIGYLWVKRRILHMRMAFGLKNKLEQMRSLSLKHASNAIKVATMPR